MAAGGSGRFGGPKLLARIGRESMLRRAARVALGSRPAGCVVVLGARASRLRAELRGFPVRIVVNRNWRRGLAGSLRMGVAALPREAPAALVLLADQVAVGPAELELLIAAWRRAPRSIVAASAGQILGPPVLFPRKAFAALRRLHGPAGARQLLVRMRAQVQVLDMPESAVDIDTEGDLARLRRVSLRRRISPNFQPHVARGQQPSNRRLGNPVVIKAN
ncbi:MAG: nucleotidyltransferase family protein [Gammaproteobacteria bacterium]